MMCVRGQLTGHFGRGANNYWRQFELAINEGKAALMKTVDHLFEETNLTLDEIAARAGLPVERVMAIAEGRWTPSPEERAQIAAAFSVAVSDVSWGHSMNPRNIRYHRFGLKEEF